MVRVSSGLGLGGGLVVVFFSFKLSSLRWMSGGKLGEENFLHPYEYGCIRPTNKIDKFWGTSDIGEARIFAAGCTLFLPQTLVIRPNNFSFHPGGAPAPPGYAYDLWVVCGSIFHDPIKRLHQLCDPTHRRLKNLDWTQPNPMKQTTELTIKNEVC